MTAGFQYWDYRQGIDKKRPAAASPTDRGKTLRTVKRNVPANSRRRILPGRGCERPRHLSGLTRFPAHRRVRLKFPLSAP